MNAVQCSKYLLVRYVLPQLEVHRKKKLSFGKTEKFDKCCTGLTPNGGRARKKKGHVKNRTKILNMQKVKSEKKKERKMM